MRGRAVAARRAHNPEVAGSSPAPATKKDTFKVSFLLLDPYFRTGTCDLLVVGSSLVLPTT